ncbi:hypothetical protein GJ496_009811 [Pomphorhynchus laevis]|nr:hypothetical protein GJ496_009811 [Pomphorhynchus laevis]
MKSTAQKNGEHVKVVVRIRPLPMDNNDIKKSSGTGCIYDRSVSPLVFQVLQGRVSTVIAYGQSGSGKTSTIIGLRSLAANEIFEKLFQEHTNSFYVKLSCIEIYQDFIKDLLLKDKVLMQSSHKKITSTNINDFTWKKASSCRDIEKIFHVVDRRRQCASTKLNSCSSRSHLIITMIIVDDSSKAMQNPQNFRDKAGQHGECYQKAGGRLTFVDLAGSERLKKSESQGRALQEACKINQSLNALNNVILNINEKKKYIPYRNSKLTMILSDALGGYSHTLMIANISHAKANIQETLYTLRFAELSRSIKNCRVQPIKRCISNITEKFNNRRNVLSTPTTTASSSLQSSFRIDNFKKSTTSNDIRRLQITLNNLKTRIRREHCLQQTWTTHLQKLIRTSRNLTVDHLLSILSKNADELAVIYSKIIAEMRLHQNFIKQMRLTNKELHSSRQMFNDLLAELKRKIQEYKELEKVYKGCQQQLMKQSVCYGDNASALFTYL